MNKIDRAVTEFVFPISIIGLIVGVLALSVVDCEFEHRSGQTRL